jgi:8-oxo-dGTP pyrophosphatase MutT (NUDIX family)
MSWPPGALRSAIVDVLRRRNPVRADRPGFRRAAVLLPLYETEAGLHLLLVQRTEQVPTHKGQIAFPGGGFEEADGDLLNTALREAEEEIGLRPQEVEILGTLDDTVTVSSRHVVRPYVGFVPPEYPYRLDAFEVERLIHLPVAPLLAGAAFRAETWEREGQPLVVYFYDYEGSTVWGLTARILKQFVEIVRGALGSTSDEGPDPGGARGGNR